MTSNSYSSPSSFLDSSMPVPDHAECSKMFKELLAWKVLPGNNFLNSLYSQHLNSKLSLSLKQKACLVASYKKELLKQSFVPVPFLLPESFTRHMPTKGKVNLLFKGFFLRSDKVETGNIQVYLYNNYVRAGVINLSAKPSPVYIPASAEFSVPGNPTLTELLSNFPVAVSKYGKEISRCCFCGLTLTDPASVYVGYGPTCAEKYGLPHGEVSENSPKLPSFSSLSSLDPLDAIDL